MKKYIFLPSILIWLFILYSFINAIIKGDTMLMYAEGGILLLLLIGFVLYKIDMYIFDKECKRDMNLLNQIFNSKKNKVNQSKSDNRKIFYIE
jgi:hypothetical protein